MRDLGDGGEPGLPVHLPGRVQLLDNKGAISIQILLHPDRSHFMSLLLSMPKHKYCDCKVSLKQILRWNIGHFSPYACAATQTHPCR